MSRTAARSVERRIAARAWLCRTVSAFADSREELPDENLWREIIEAADSAMLLPRLWHDIGDRADRLPADVADFLRTVDALNQDRNERLHRQTCAVIARLNLVDVEPVLLKGNALLMTGGSRARARMVNDIDIWVPEDQGQRAAIAALERAGYAPRKPLEGFKKSDSHHYPPFFAAEGTARVELHHRLIRPVLDGLLDEQTASLRLRREMTDGLRFRLLDPDDALALSYVQSTHMAVPAFDTARVPLMKWVDFVDRAREMGRFPIGSRRDCGLAGPDTAIDLRFLTAAAIYFSLPYTGPRDERYVVDREARLDGRWLGIMLRGFVAGPRGFRSLHPSRWANWPRILRDRFREFRGSKGL